MKNKWFLIGGFCLLLLSSCSENLLLSPPGVISFYSGETESTGSSSLSFNKLQSIGIFSNGIALEAYVYVDKIEISKTGEEWVEILKEPIEVKVKDGEMLRIGSPKNISKGQYHGLRITVQHKVKYSIVSPHGIPRQPTNVDITLEKAPIHMGAGQGFGWHTIPVTKVVTLTSANGYLDPFDIEGGSETFIIFEFKPSWIGTVSNITDWDFYIGARATRFLY